MKLILILLLSVNLFAANSTTKSEESVVKSDNVEEKEEQHLFPIWGDKAKELGHKLPKPYGVNISRVVHDEVFAAKSAEVNGIDLFPILAKGDVNVDTRTNINMVRADFWLFPFMNLYFGFGQVHSQVSLRFQRTAAGAVIPQCDGVNRTYCNIQFNAKGATGTIGGVLAGGYNNFFAMTNFSFTDVLIEEELDVAIFSAAFRLGYNAGSLQAFIGAMYIDDEVEVNAETNGIKLEAVLESTGWHTTSGLNYEINQEFNVTTEISFGDRYMYLLELGYRF